MRTTEHDPIASEIVLCIPALRRFARTFNHRAIDSDDLVQETLLKALSHIDKFQPGTNLRAWLFTIMRNSFCSRARLAKREPPGFNEDCCDLATAAPANQEWHICGHELEDAISRLRPESRDVITIIAIDGASYAAAAALLNCPVGTVKSRLNRARALLAEELQ